MSADSEQFKRRGSHERRLSLVSERVGPKGRTFHLHIGSATKAKPVGKTAKIDYITREGNYSKQDADFESAAGRDADEMREILDAVDRATKRRNGRVAIPLTMELPHELSNEDRNRIANQMCTWFEGHGHPTMAVVHGNGKVQPHLHLITTARPVRSIVSSDEQDYWLGSFQCGDWEVAAEGTRGKKQEGRLFADKAQVRDFRRNVAAPIINDALSKAGLEGNWHGGRLAETGIERDAKKRVRQSDWAKGKRERNPISTAAMHNIHEDRRKIHRRLRNERERAKHERMIEKATTLETRNLFLEKELRQAEKIKDSALDCVAEAHEHAALQAAELARSREKRRQLESALQNAKADLEKAQTPTIDQSRAKMSDGALKFVKDVLEKAGYSPKEYSAHLEQGGSAELWNLVRSHTALKKAKPPSHGRDGQVHRPEPAPYIPEPLRIDNIERANDILSDMALSPEQLEQTLEATRDALARTDMGSRQGPSDYRRLNLGLVALRDKIQSQKGANGSAAVIPPIIEGFKSRIL